MKKPKLACHGKADRVPSKAKLRYVTADDLRPLLADGSLVRVTLGVGESAWNPVCPECRIWGPAVIEYRRHADGGVDAVLVEGTDGHAR